MKMAVKIFVFLGLSLALFAAQKESSKPAGKNVKAPVPSAPDAKTGPVLLEKSLYQEVLQVLMEKYAEPSAIGINRLNETALDGLLNSLQGTVRMLESESKGGRLSGSTNLVDSVAVIDPFVGYMRVHGVEEGTARQVEDALRKMEQEQRVSSQVLDLRGAGGASLAAAARVASLFFSDTRELFTLQNGAGPQVFYATPSSCNFEKLLMILVNQETREAAELLAGVLQEQSRAVVLGQAPTAGRIFEMSETKLSNGKTLRYATIKALLPMRGDLFMKRVQPDILVSFDSGQEMEIISKAFQPPVVKSEPRYYSEAILTGRELAPFMTGGVEDKKKEDAEPLSNRDLVLQRALDLIKGIVALRLPGY
ncbi:MAG: S41 family peptidase [Verrucomicrobiae bacterium]|nr:S41 family peptidase [Verrucomicrobiae bacterium]